MPRVSLAANALACASVRRSWHQSKIRASWRRSVAAGVKRPGDGLLAIGGIAAGLVVEGIGESRLGHGRFAGHEQLELLPAQGLPLPLPAQQAQPLRAEENPRALRI